jgi:hypothetical protein
MKPEVLSVETLIGRLYRLREYRIWLDTYRTPDVSTIECSELVLDLARRSELGEAARS